jgi:hypothetical protein
LGAGDGVPPSWTFSVFHKEENFVSASRRNQHARRVRYLDEEFMPFIRTIGGWKLLFGHFRDGEFLKSRIVTQRIEHEIEPEHRRRKRAPQIDCCVVSSAVLTK